MAFNLALAAARNVGWRPAITLYYRGDPIAAEGATIAMQVRLYPGAPGAPLIDLKNIPFTDGASATPSAPDRRVIEIEPNIAEPLLSALPKSLINPEPGEADRFAHDIVITYADGHQERLAAGDFFVEPGVTD